MKSDRITWRRAFMLALTLLLAGCGPSLNRLNDLARIGAIEPNAPVIAHVHVEIGAPPEKVWSVLINAPAWPQWESDIESVSVKEPLGLGTRFNWGEGGSAVHSQVQLFEPGQRLVWTGTAYRVAKAVHVWELQPVAGGRTLVTVNESMDGPMMGVIFPSQKLGEGANAWLVDLKREAERQ